MKNNNNNNLIDNIGESDFNDSIKKESSSFNTTKDLSPNSINKPWYKKKGTIIGISSTLGAGILTTAIAVPLVLTSAQNTAELSKVITVYDLTTKTAKLIVEGKNLPNDKALYSVFRETTTKASTEIAATTIKLNFISATEISLDFKDDSITDKTVYQVKLNNGTSSGNAIITKPTENLKQPTFTITTSPTEVNLPQGGATQTATFTITPSQITNPITGQSLSYQWKTSDSNTTTDETKWSVIPNETKATYTYDAKDLAINTKKYFKCIVSYKYANSVTSTILSVVKTNQPTINISAQSSNVDLPYTTTDSTTTLSVTANVVNGTSTGTLSYQWKTSDTENGTFNNIASATNNTYELSGIVVGTKKYYKCTISYTGATSLDSTPIYVAKNPKPTISITEDLSSTISLTYTQTTATLKVVAKVNNPVTGGDTLSYQWQESTTNTDTDFTDISNQTTDTYNLTDVAFGFTKYYRCKISATSADVVTSTKAHVTRVAQPTFTVTQLVPKILTSADTNFTLDATAQITSPIGGQSATYQWQSSTSATGTYQNIDGATNATYTKQLDPATKNSLRDTWYKCVVTYIGAVTPTINSNTALVKMTLTSAEARAEFIKWSAITTNYEPIIKEFFKGINTSGSLLHYYYTSLHDHEFIVGSEPKNVEIVSVVGETLPVTGDSNGLKTYKIRLKTLGESKYRSKTGSDTTTETTLPTGSFIEFYTLFSFQGNNIILRNTADSANYDMNLSLTFFENETTIRTTVEWTSTNADNGPSDANPLKKGAYPVKIFGIDGTTSVFVDSLRLPMRPANTAFVSTTTPAIPTYHIKLTH